MRAQRSIRILELKKHATEIVRQIRDQGVVIDIIDRDEVVAQLRAVRPLKQSAKARPAIWKNLDQLATEIGASWLGGVSAADAVQEVRRVL